MQIAMLIDEGRLRREHRMLARLTVGLVAEGARVLRVIPDCIEDVHVRESERLVGLVPGVTIPEHVVPWLRSRRLQTLVDACEKRTPDVIYAVGEGMWPIALDLAKAVNRPVALEVWCRTQVRKAARAEQGSIGAYVALTKPLAAELRRRVPAELVSEVPMGIAIREGVTREKRADDRSIGLSIIGPGRQALPYRHVLEAIASLRLEQEAMHAFLAIEGDDPHQIWRIVHDLDLLNCVTLLDLGENYQAMLAATDALVLPEQLDGLNSLVLDAMLDGLTVFAVPNDQIDVLEPEQSGVVVELGSSERWRAELGRLRSQRLALQRLGGEGRARVLQRHASHLQIAGLLATFEQVIHGGALQFAT